MNRGGFGPESWEWMASRENADLLVVEAARSGSLVEAKRAHAAGASPAGLARALCACARKGHVRLVRWLLADAGVDEACAPDGVPPLVLAAGAGHVAVVGALADHARAQGGAARLRRLLSGADASTGACALHRAVGCESVEVVARLLALGAEPDAPDRAECTPLHHALRRGAVACARTLLRAGAAMSARAHDGRSVLQLAELSGHAHLARALQRELRTPTLDEKGRAHSAPADAAELASAAATAASGVPGCARAASAGDGLSLIHI